MKKSRLQEIRRAAKGSDLQLIVEELCIEIERLQTPAELRLEDDRRPSSKARGTQDEFEAFAKELGMPTSDGEFFHHHLAERGWIVAGKPVKDWRAGFRKWKAAGWLPSQKVNGAMNGSHGPRVTAL